MIFTDIAKVRQKYNIIYADPPWAYDDHLDPTRRLGYQSMENEIMGAMPVERIGADDCTLFMWATWPTIEDAPKVMRTWGFEYKTLGFIWIKTTGRGYHMGMGHYTRANTEPCLIGTRGHPHRKRADITQLIFAPVKKHSAKPDIVRTKIVQLMGDVPRIELFARTRADGWDSFGNDEKLQNTPLEAFT